MTSIWLIPLAALLWRFQGGAWFAARLPGRPLWYVAPILGIVTGLADADWRPGAALALALLWSGLVPHGRWYTLGRAPRDLAGPPNAFERVVERLAGDDNHIALLLAKLVACLGFVAAAIGLFNFPAIWIAACLPGAIVLAYEIGWRFSRTGTHVGEWLTGGLFGIFAAAL